jgi:Mn2+/Fe2+ NRAMP family transporter
MAGKPSARRDYPDSRHHGASFPFSMDREDDWFVCLMIIVFALSAVWLNPDWAQLAGGLIAKVSQTDTKHTLLYWCFAVGIFSAMFMEYEVHFLQRESTVS